MYKRWYLRQIRRVKYRFSTGEPAITEFVRYDWTDDGGNLHKTDRNEEAYYPVPRELLKSTRHMEYKLSVSKPEPVDLPPID